MRRQARGLRLEAGAVDEARTLALVSRFRGPVPYGVGVASMDEAARALASGGGPPQLLLFEHHPVITLGVRGRRSSILIGPSELARRGIEIRRADRGGDATWHGPGQIVGYPVVDLRRLGLSIPGFVLAVEEALVDWLDRHGARCVVRPGAPGVWTSGGSKMASVGVRVARGITTHGFALNLEGPLPGADAVAPCGMEGVRLTTLQEIAGRTMTPREAARGIADAVAVRLNMVANWEDDGPRR